MMLIKVEEEGNESSKFYMERQTDPDFSRNLSLNCSSVWRAHWHEQTNQKLFKINRTFTAESICIFPIWELFVFCFNSQML